MSARAKRVKALRRARGGIKIPSSSNGAAVSPSERKAPDKKFKGLPGYDLAAFLHAKLQSREWSANDLFKAMREHGFSKTDDDTVYKWVKGQSTPRLNDMHQLALALGYRDWFALVAAIERFTLANS